MRIFVDESGHSGADLYDPNQPILTYVGVWLDDEGEASVEEFATRERARQQIQIPGELKGKALLRRRRGRELISNLFVELERLRVPVCLVAAHKTHMAAGVVVEDCTDSAYNPEFGDRWSWDSRLKEPLSEMIFEAAPAEMLAEVWRLRSGENKDAWKAAYTSLLFALQLSRNAELAELATRMRAVDLDELWDCNEIARTEKRDYSPNQAAFNALLQLSDQLAESLGLRDLDLVHDEQAQFQGQFEFWFKALASAGEVHLPFPNGNELRWPISQITTLRFADSEAHVGLRIADIVASSARLFLQERLDGVEDRSADYSGTFTSLIQSGHLRYFPYVIGPESWQLDAMRSLLPNLVFDT